MMRPSPSWFSHGVQWNANVSYVSNGIRIRGNVTIFSSDDRDDAIAEVFKDSQRHGFTYVNINRLARIG